MSPAILSGIFVQQEDREGIPDMRADHPNGCAFALEGNDFGCLLLHGFTGTPGQMRWLGEQLHERGYTVSAPMLPGHGATIEDMRASNWQEWLNGARASYLNLRQRSKQVAVIGLSMGGALALILAEEYQVDAVITLSAAIRLKIPFAWATPLIAPFYPYQKWNDDEKQSPNFLHDLNCGYDGVPVGKVRDLSKIVGLAKRNLSAVVAPTLIIQPEHDKSVDPSGGRMIFEHIRSKEKQLLMLPNSGHVCTLDCDREQVLYAILQHLRNLAATKALA